MFSVPEFIVPFAGGIANIIIGLIVLLHNWRSVTNRWFFGLALSIGFWSIFTSFSVMFAERYLLLMHVTLFIAWLVAPLFLFTSINFPMAKNIIPKAFAYGGWAITFVIMILHILFPSFVVETVSGSGESFIISPGVLYFLSPFHLTTFFIIGFIFLRRAYDRASPRLRAQMFASFIGIVAAITAVFVTNTFSPILGFYKNPLWFGPIFALIGMVSFSYMIFEAGDELLG